MKKFLAIVSILSLYSFLFSAPPVEIVNPQIKVYSDQPYGIAIYNYNVGTAPVKILDENLDYAYFYIANDSDYTLLISTSSTFNTYFRIPKNTIFSSDVVATLYGKLETGSGTVSVMLELSK